MSDTVAQVDRPDWTLLERACRIWTEDDATVGLPDHETLAAAFKRIYKVPMPDCLERYDDGESVYKRLPAHLVTCESYPGNWAIAAWPILFIGDRITVVLKWSSSVKTDKGRLVHTTTSSHKGNLNVSHETFQANDDDRPQHNVTDHGVTWLFGHVDFKSAEALRLLRAAEQADELRSDKSK